MRKIIAITALICCIKTVKAQTPDCLKVNYFVSTMLDTFDIFEKAIPNYKVIVLKPRADNLIKDNALNAISLTSKIGLKYTPIKEGESIYFVYSNGNMITYDSNFIFFLTPSL